MTDKDTYLLNLGFSLMHEYNWVLWLVECM